MDERAVVDATRGWVREVVIGLNLCPFAARPFRDGRIRYAVTPAADEDGLLADLARELEALASAPPAEVETTLLIHPRVLGDFLDFNDFLGVADRLVRDLGLRGVIQVVGFHPGYRFAGTRPGAVENYTNRSPYPMLHLLREASVSAVASDPAALEEIPRRNVAVLREMGLARVLELLRTIDPNGAAGSERSAE